MRYRPRSAYKEMFKNRNHITRLLGKCKKIETKWEVVEKAQGPLHYIFGKTLISKPWLTYEERYCNN